MPSLSDPNAQSEGMFFCSSDIYLQIHTSWLQPRTNQETVAVQTDESINSTLLQQVIVCMLLAINTTSRNVLHTHWNRLLLVKFENNKPAKYVMSHYDQRNAFLIAYKEYYC